MAVLGAAAGLFLGSCAASVLATREPALVGTAIGIAAYELVLVPLLAVDGHEGFGDVIFTMTILAVPFAVVSALGALLGMLLRAVRHEPFDGRSRG